MPIAKRQNNNCGKFRLREVPRVARLHVNKAAITKRCRETRSAA